jgi:hypothetical protein
MSHFQGWKREYIPFTVQPPPADAHVTVISANGFIYLRLNESESTKLTGGSFQLKSYGELLGNRLPSGRLTISDGLRKNQIIYTKKSPWSYIQRILGNDLSIKLMDTIGGASFIPESLLYNNEASELSTGYCIQHNSKLSACTCPVLGSEILISNYYEIKNKVIGIISVGWADEINQIVLSALLSIWKGNRNHVVSESYNLIICLTFAKVIVVAYTNNFPEYLSTLDPTNELTLIAVNITRCSDFSKGSRILPDKMLYNMGLDFIDTELVIVTPLRLNAENLEFDVNSLSVTDALLKEYTNYDDELKAIAINIGKGKVSCEY